MVTSLIIQIEIKCFSANDCKRRYRISNVGKHMEKLMLHMEL